MGEEGVGLVRRGDESFGEDEKRPLLPKTSLLVLVFEAAVPDLLLLFKKLCTEKDCKSGENNGVVDPLDAPPETWEGRSLNALLSGGGVV